MKSGSFINIKLIQKEYRSLDQPHLTLPAKEASHLQEAYADASVILEYGAGGSTWIAAQMPQKKIISIDSDRMFVRRLAKQIKAAGLPSIPLLHYVDIGPVGKWGKPLGPGSWNRFLNYPLSPWDLPAFPQPDLVLIDGRFRAACFAAVRLFTTKPVRILIDDYTARTDYHIVERLCQPSRTIGRMAEFEVKPGVLSQDQIRDVIEMFFRASYGEPDPLNVDRNFYDLIADSPDLALQLPDPMSAKVNGATITEEKRLQAKIRRLRQQRLLLAIPYAVILSPLLLPTWLGGYAAKVYRRRRKPTINTISDNRVQHASPRASDPIHEAEMARRKDDFVLYRIIGNDLEPRHSEGQSLQNVRFILDKEPNFKGCHKKWLLNRIYDKDMERQIIKLLDDHGQDYTRLPFYLNEYAQVPFDFSLFPEPDFLTSTEFRKLDQESRLRAVAQSYRLKNNYVMNNNGARNEALRAGQSEAKWIMPWDGNCFLTSDAWDELQRTVTAKRHLVYFNVPMARFSSNDDLLSHMTRPEAREEPQIIFRCDAEENFDTAHPYGRRPKVELLARLGVEGPWGKWGMDPWDLPIHQAKPNPDRVKSAGWVARLSSGKPHLEKVGATVSKIRTVARTESIIATLNKLDDQVLHLDAAWYYETTKGKLERA